MAGSFSHHKQETQLVIFEEISGGMKVVLNRPKKLNCLNYELIVELLKIFEAYEKDPTISFVILKGNGRAFCAGGDVTALMTLTNAGTRSLSDVKSRHRSLNISYIFIEKYTIHLFFTEINGHWSVGANFFGEQYSLDYLLGTYKKPLIALINGIVMGGGAGLSMNATFRIVTENTMFAMPEASIGSIPDVGASNFLSRLSGFFGEYVALTGVRLNGIEMVECGLATHFILSKDLASMENEVSMMASCDARNIPTISEIINKYANGETIRLENAYSRLDIINKCFSRETVEDILSSLENFAVCRHEKWIPDAVKSMKSASPLCLKLTLKLIREGRLQKLEECLAREHLVVSHLLRRTVNDDFYEGPRAMLIDKDKKPQWSPSKLELVNVEMLSKCFSMIDNEDWKPLRLFARTNLDHAITSRI